MALNKDSSRRCQIFSNRSEKRFSLPVFPDCFLRRDVEFCRLFIRNETEIIEMTAKFFFLVIAIYEPFCFTVIFVSEMCTVVGSYVNSPSNWFIKFLVVWKWLIKPIKWKYEWSVHFHWSIHWNDVLQPLRKSPLLNSFRWNKVLAYKVIQ